MMYTSRKECKHLVHKVIVAQLVVAHQDAQNVNICTRVLLFLHVNLLVHDELFANISQIEHGVDDALVHLPRDFSRKPHGK